MSLVAYLTNFIRPLLDNHVYTIRCGIAKGLKRKGGLGFLKFIPTKEEKFLMALDLTGEAIYDIGGYEGIFTLFFANAAGRQGHVVTFEPNPQNYAKIIENVGLNNLSNINVYQIGIGAKKETAILTFLPSLLATGSICEGVRLQFSKHKGAKSIQVKVDSLDNQAEVNNLPKPDFVKIDVEGLEMDVLLGMEKTVKSCGPRLLIELHDIKAPSKGSSIKNIVTFLLDNEYHIYHIESENTIPSLNVVLPKKGHLYCLKT